MVPAGRQWPEVPGHGVSAPTRRPPVRRRRRNRPGSPQLARSCGQSCRGPPFETLTAQSWPDGLGGPLTGSRAASLPAVAISMRMTFPHVGTATRPTGTPVGTIVTAERYALSARSIMRAGTRVYGQRCLPAHDPQFTLTSAERRGPAIHGLPGSHSGSFHSGLVLIPIPFPRTGRRHDEARGFPILGSGDRVPGSAESRGLRACAQGVRQSPRPW